MEGPHPGGTAFRIKVAPVPGKYALICSLQQYKYKLHNTDIDWIENKNSSFLLENLPSGDYQINIKANTLNDCLESNVIVLFINIKPPMWRSWWLLIFCKTTIIYISKMIINQLKEKEKRKNLEKIYINDKIVAIELSALKGQINSNFIFNILNGIKSIPLLIGAETRF